MIVFERPNTAGLRGGRYQGRKIGLFIPCHIDALFPDGGMATPQGET